MKHIKCTKNKDKKLRNTPNKLTIFKINKTECKKEIKYTKK